MTWIKIENNNLTKPPHFDETTGLANCHLNQDWLLENGYEQWSDEQVQNWYNENASAFNLACDYFRQVCEEIRLLTGIEDFRGGYDDMPNFYDSPKYKTDEGVRLAAAWAGLNDLCKHEASLIGIGSPEWWHLCWDGYTLKPLPVAIYNVSGSSYDKINGDYYEEGFYNGYPYYKNKNDIIAKVNDSGLWNFYDGNTSISKTSNSYNFLEDNEYWTTIGNQETLNITKVNNGTPYFKLLHNDYSISHTEYDVETFSYDDIANNMITISYVDSTSSYLYSCVLENNTDNEIISTVEDGIVVGGKYGEASASYRLTITSGNNENIYVKFNVSIEADIKEPIIITANDATLTIGVNKYIEFDVYEETNVSVNRGDVYADISGDILPGDVYFEGGSLWGRCDQEGEYDILVKFISEDDESIYKTVTIHLIVEASAGESINKAFEYNEIFDGEEATSEGLAKITGDVPKYVKVNLTAGTEYLFYAKNDDGDSYIALFDKNGERLEGSDEYENEEGETDAYFYCGFNYTPTESGDYYMCYGSWGNLGEGEGDDTYCSYVKATITPPPVAPEQLIETYYNSAIQSEQDASNAASQTVGIAESMQELKDKLTEVLNGQETENI
jgi:hypothetical protein